MLDWFWLLRWPSWKVRIRTWYWIMRYGGKGRIPKDVVFRALKRSADRMEENLRKARESMDLERVSESERLMLREALMKAQGFQSAVDDKFGPDSI